MRRTFIRRMGWSYGHCLCCKEGQKTAQKHPTRLDWLIYTRNSWERASPQDPKIMMPDGLWMGIYTSLICNILLCKRTIANTQCGCYLMAVGACISVRMRVWTDAMWWSTTPHVSKRSFAFATQSSS